DGQAPDDQADEDEHGPGAHPEVGDPPRLVGDLAVGVARHEPAQLLVGATRQDQCGQGQACRGSEPGSPGALRDLGDHWEMTFHSSSPAPGAAARSGAGSGRGAGTRRSADAPAVPPPAEGACRAGGPAPDGTSSSYVVSGGDTPPARS